MATAIGSPLRSKSTPHKALIRMKPEMRRLSPEQIAALGALADRAYHLALRATGVPSLAEEAVQEAFAALLRKPPRDYGSAETAGYFLRAVRGAALNLLRAQRRQKAREDRYMQTQPAEAAPADETCAALETARAARRALAELPQEERETIGLCCEMDLSHREASLILGVPESTIGARLNRGLEKLRLTLTAQGYAALAPVGIAGALTQLGVVKAPTALAARVAELGAGAAWPAASAAAAKKVFLAGKSKGTLAAGKSSLGLAAALALATVATGLVLVLRQPATPTPAKTVPQAVTPAPQQASPTIPADSNRIYVQEFSAWATDEASACELVRMPDGNVDALASRPFVGGSPNWNPHVVLDWSGRTEEGQERALFRIPAGVEIRLRIKVEKAGEWYLAIQPLHRASNEETLATEVTAVGTGWQEFVLHAEDLKPYRRAQVHTPDLTPGLEIGSFSIYGFATGTIWLDRLEVRRTLEAKSTP